MGGSQSTPAAGTCVAGNTTYAGRVCSMQCGVDYPGGDYNQITVSNYLGCLQACASDPVCTDSQFDQQSNVCFLKSTLTTPRGLPYIDSAVCYSQQNGQSSSSAPLVSIVTVTATLTTTATSTTSAVSTETDTATTTAVSTFISATTATSTATDTITTTATTTTTSLSTVVNTVTTTSTTTTTSVSTEIDTLTATATSVTTATLSTACPSAASLVPSICTFTYTTTTTTYTSTISTIIYSLPTKCYNTALIQSLSPTPVSSSTTIPVVNYSSPITYACSATVQTVSTTTVAAVSTAVLGRYSWPFYVQAQNASILNGNYGRIVTYDAKVGNSFMQFTAPANGPATQFQLDNNCVLGLAWNTSNPNWIGASEGSDGLVYFGTPQTLGQSQYYYGYNTSCAVSAASVLTCSDNYGNTTYLTGAVASSDQFNNDLNIAGFNQSKNIFGNTLYPVTLGLTFV